MKIKCNCKSDKNGNTKAAQYQDATYGKGVRIATPELGKNGPKKGTCTVCGASSESTLEA